MGSACQKTQWARLCWVSLCLIAGCSGTYESSVSGTVTLDGAAVPRGTVAFFPVEQGPSAHGRTDESGRYTLSVGREVGLPPGDYTVTVVASEAAQVPDDWVGPPPPGDLITPMKYASKNQSGLRYTVEPGKNEISIELSSS